MILELHRVIKCHDIEKEPSTSTQGLSQVVLRLKFKHGEKD